MHLLEFRFIHARVNAFENSAILQIAHHFGAMLRGAAF
jgi:hypothetical protein